MFLAWLIVAGGIAVVLASGGSLVVAGLRAGDQAGDATVTAAADAGRVAIVAVVRNPATSRSWPGSRRGVDCCQPGSTPG